jgi:F0F1-type ATP synthase membrane subunit a
MIQMNRENIMMIATAVCLVGIIFIFKELNKTKEEMNGFRTFSEQLVQHMNTSALEESEEDETEPNLEKIEEKKGE